MYLYSVEEVFSISKRILKLRGLSWWVSSTDGLTHKDLSRDEELLHGHHVHVDKMLNHKPLALVLVVVTSAQAEVLLKIDDVLSNHDGILNVSLDPLKALDALVTSVLLESVTSTSSLANMDGSVHKVVLNNSKEHANVVSGQGVLTPTLVFPKGWAVVSSDVVMDWHSPHLDHPAELVHLINTLGTGEPCIWSSQGSCNEEGEEKHCLHVLRFVNPVRQVF